MAAVTRTSPPARPSPLSREAGEGWGGRRKDEASSSPNPRPAFFLNFSPSWAFARSLALPRFAGEGTLVRPVRAEL